MWNASLSTATTQLFWDDSCGLYYGNLGEEILRREFDWSGMSEKHKEAVLDGIKFHNAIIKKTFRLKWLFCPTSGLVLSGTSTR